MRQLMELARAEVRTRFGVELEAEVRLLGDWRTLKQGRNDATYGISQRQSQTKRGSDGVSGLWWSVFLRLSSL